MKSDVHPVFHAASAMTGRLRRVPLPYPVALVLGGLLLGALHLFSAPHLTRGLLFSIFLPGLLFEAAFHIPVAEFWGNRLTIAALAVPGVIISAALVALVLPPAVHLLNISTGFGWSYALVFGALISATDPIAVIGLFRTVGAPRRLRLLVEVESLLNDGTSIVFFTMSLALLDGTPVSAAPIALQFLAVVGVAALLGAVIGLAGAAIMRRFRRPLLWIVVTLPVAYGSFVAAEALGYSGVIATVTAGMLCGSSVRLRGAAARCHATTDTFWKSVAFGLNSVVFLLIGLTVHMRVLGAFWVPVLVAFAVVTGSRALVVGASRTLVAHTREHFPWRWTPVLIWGGLRGALPMVLALSLPASFSYRELIIAMTFGVALLSIVLQGLTMLPLLRRLALQAPP